MQEGERELPPFPLLFSFHHHLPPPPSASAASRTSSLPMTSLLISEVPAPISYSLASRRIRPGVFLRSFRERGGERERRSVSSFFSRRRVA